MDDILKGIKEVDSLLATMVVSGDNVFLLAGARSKLVRLYDEIKERGLSWGSTDE